MDNKAREKYVAENPTPMPIEDYLSVVPFDGQITYGEMGVCALVVALVIYAVMKGKYKLRSVGREIVSIQTL